MTIDPSKFNMSGINLIDRRCIFVYLKFKVGLSIPFTRKSISNKSGVFFETPLSMHEYESAGGSECRRALV
jgi:hypothetical protein